jgi:hypothetical protein
MPCMRCVSTPGSWPGRRVIEDAPAPGEAEEELAFKAIECLAASSGTGPRDRLGPESGPYRRPTCRASWLELTRHRPPYLGTGANVVISPGQNSRPQQFRDRPTDACDKGRMEEIETAPC